MGVSDEGVTMRMEGGLYFNQFYNGTGICRLCIAFKNIRVAFAQLSPNHAVVGRFLDSFEHWVALILEMCVAVVASQGRR